MKNLNTIYREENEYNVMTPLQILLVEDSPADIRLIKEALKANGVTIDKRISISVVSDGIEALHYLRKEPPFENAISPDIILLDLNLPKKDGRSVLMEIKEDPSLKQIPVIVLTTSEAESDIINCYKLHANSFITKPMDLDDFFDLMKSFKLFWLSKAKLPVN